MKKNYLILSGLVFFLSCTMYLISCSESDDVEPMANKIDPNSHFPRLRNTSWERHNYSSNECGIWCIVKMSGQESLYNDVYDYAVEAGWNPEDKTHGLTNTQIIKVCDKLRDLKGIDLNISNSIGDPVSARNTLRSIGESGSRSNVMIQINDRNTGAHYVTLKEYRSSNDIAVFDSNSSRGFKYITLDDVQAIIY